MILQALYEYYQRLGTLGDTLAPEGWIDKPIDYVLHLDRQGNCVELVCHQRLAGKKRESGPARRVPNIGKQALKHTNSGDDANLLWDNAGFALGLGKNGQKKLESFAHTIEEYLHSDVDEGLAAVKHFLQRVRGEPSVIESLLSHRSEDSESLRSGRPTVTFQLADDPDQIVCQRPNVVARYERHRREVARGALGQCLVTGEMTEIEAAHPVIKGVWHAQTAGASIVSFNARAFESYGKTGRQGENSPVGKLAAFAYTTALNHLLGKGSRNRVQVGDASTVFWAQKSDEVEDAFADFFGEGDNPDARVETVRALLESVQSGKFDGARGNNRFYVLGLAPNAARIAVRFWHAAPLNEIASRVRDWFADIEMTRGPSDPEYPSLFRLLTACAVQGKADNIPPNLGGDVMRAILSGSPFPSTWLNAAVQRCRAEQRVIYLRAAAIKACLNRTLRHHATEKEFLLMLDPSNTNTAYRLGRLFAVLEKIQEEASPGLNVTIRERYYGAASSTPVTVFTTLLRLKNHHLAKLSNRGRAVNLEKLIVEITQGVSDFPSHLGLPEQGRFALGYYHQRQAFFTKSESTQTA